MKKGKATKRALVTSAVSLLLCVTMLIGTTFAWFTDTASTAVNKIQSGKLLVDIVDADGTSLRDKELKFMQAQTQGDPTAVSADNILWEPGATFKTQSFKIKNNGNLALKYKLTLNGISGDSELLKVIEFSVVSVSNGVETTKDLNTFEGYLTTAGALSDELYIKGHMAESAGNEYQGKTLEGIGITVVATQYTYEYDSNGNDYDENAEYPVYASITKTVAKNEENVTTNDKPITIATTEVAKETAQEVTPTPVATAEVSSGTKLEADATSLTLVVKEDTNPSNIEIASTQVAKTLEIKMEGLDNTSNTTPVKIEFYVGKNLEDFKLWHTESSGKVQMTSKDSVKDVTEHNTYYYNNETGVVTMAVKSFSPFTYIYLSVATDEEFAAATNTTNKIINISSSKLLVKFAKNVNSDVNYGGYTINLTTDIDLGGAKWTPICADNAFTFDGQNHTISNFKVEGTFNVGFFGVADVTTIKNLKIDNATVTGINHVGAIVGHGVCTTIVNCEVTNSTITTENVDDNGDKAGAVIGYLSAEWNASVTDCKVDNCTVTGYRDIGGLIGIANASGECSWTVTGNTVTNTKVVQDKTVNTRPNAETYNIGELIGRRAGSKNTEQSNTATDVTISTISAAQ